jgi:hypothetical protein
MNSDTQRKLNDDPDNAYVPFIRIDGTGTNWYYPCHNNIELGCAPCLTHDEAVARAKQYMSNVGKND